MPDLNHDKDVQRLSDQIIRTGKQAFDPDIPEATRNRREYDDLIQRFVKDFTFFPFIDRFKHKHHGTPAYLDESRAAW